MADTLDVPRNHGWVLCAACGTGYKRKRVLDGICVLCRRPTPPHPQPLALVPAPPHYPWGPRP